MGLHQGSVSNPLFIIGLEILYREIRSGSSEELVYADDLTLVCETLEGLGGKLAAWKWALESKKLTVNVKNTDMMINNENVGRVTVEGKFPCAVVRKGVCSSSILC